MSRVRKPASEKSTAELAEWLGHEALETMAEQPESWEQLGELMDVIGVVELMLRRFSHQDISAAVQSWKAKIRARGVPPGEPSFPALASVATLEDPSV